MPTNIEKLRGLLQELFQLDQADLDFGIYRIMNQKRDEIVRFLDNDLLPQVKEAFEQYKSADKSEISEGTRQARPDHYRRRDEPRGLTEGKGTTSEDQPNPAWTWRLWRTMFSSTCSISSAATTTKAIFFRFAGTRKASMPFPTRAKRSSCIGPTPTNITLRAANTSATTSSKSSSASGCVFISSLLPRSRTTTKKLPARTPIHSARRQSDLGRKRRAIHPLRVPAI